MPDPAGLRQGIHRALNEEGMNPASKPRDLQEDLKSPGSYQQ
jgi:hypothetical protein